MFDKYNLHNVFYDNNDQIKIYSNKMFLYRKEIQCSTSSISICNFDSALNITEDMKVRIEIVSIYADLGIIKKKVTKCCFSNFTFDDVQ